MKKLFIATVVLSSTFSNACTLNFEVKKQGAKTAYINGTSVSSKIRTALESQCKLNYKVMSKEEVKAMKINNLKQRLAKLETKE